ncbi:VanZ family protein [Bacillus sp. MCCB 382]|uniref:VanZ family protein n=1 Tax=Bacillus sp. MCCB 382 TaxID=2860197 RepID=UPI001C59BCA4|nr:VanZ family protein [Bacillus sp. MCCB 382]
MILVNGNVVIIPAVILYMTIRGIVVGRKYKNHVPIQWLKEMIHLLFIVYIGFVVSVTLFPFPIGFPTQSHHLLFSINVVPLLSVIHDISQIGTAYSGDVYFMITLIVRNVGGNILMFMPLGFLVPLLWEKAKSLKVVIKIGLVVSVTIECLQLLESFSGGWGRVTDIDDVIFNVLGSILGYMVYVLIMRIGGRNQI